MKKKNKARILVIDDEEQVRNLIVTILTDAGYTCDGIGDGRQALETTKEMSPAFIRREPHLKMQRICFRPNLPKKCLRSRIFGKNRRRKV